MYFPSKVITDESRASFFLRPIFADEVTATNSKTFVQNSTFKRRGLFERRGLIQKSAFLRGPCLRCRLFLKKKQNFHPKKLSKLVVPGKYVAERPKKRFEVPKNKWHKRVVNPNLYGVF